MAEKKRWYVHTTEHYSALKKEGNLALCNSMMNLKDIMLSDISQTQKDKYVVYFILYKVGTKDSQIYIERKWNRGYQGW